MKTNKLLNRTINKVVMRPITNHSDLSLMILSDETTRIIFERGQNQIFINAFWQKSVQVIKSSSCSLMNSSNFNYAQLEHMYHTKSTQGKETLKTEVKLTHVKKKTHSQKPKICSKTNLTPFWRYFEKNHALNQL